MLNMFKELFGIKTAQDTDNNNTKEITPMVVTKQTNIGAILDADPTTGKYFLAIGMHCLGCPSARNENIEQACFAHGTDADELVAKLNAHFGN
jgi:hybrid cluster-associated redox disulfide protein